MQNGFSCPFGYTKILHNNHRVVVVVVVTGHLLCRVKIIIITNDWMEHAVNIYRFDGR